MLSTYLVLQLAKAKYKLLDDGSYFGEIKGVKGVWANAKTLEKCREELKDILESWVVVTLASGEKISGLSPSKKQKHRDAMYA